VIVDVEVPNQGLTITEATLLRWLKQPGERVEKGAALFEIETDKAVQAVESPEAGYLLLQLAKEGDVVPLGRVVAKLGTDASDRAPAEERQAAPALVTKPATSTAARAKESFDPAPRGKVQASPRARRAAKRLGLDLSRVDATGARGRHIRESDVLKAAESRAPASRIRQITAERAAASFRDAPHFYLTREASAESLMRAKEGLKNVTVTDLLVKALALSLRAFPALNVQWRDGRALPLSRIDIGIAVETPQGLVVPVVRSADELPLLEMAKAREALVERARGGRSKPEDLAGGSFTLTNLGGLGVDQFQAVINPPQSGILAAGAIKPRPFAAGGTLLVQKTIFLTLSLDHRVVDGAEGARFLASLVEKLEGPDSWIGVR